jgi:hypothetical protein
VARKYDNDKVEGSATTEQIKQLEKLGLRASKTKKTTRDLIWYLERARIGMKDDSHFKDRVSHVRQVQEKLLGKQTLHKDFPDRLGTIVDLQFGRTGLMSYYIDWGEHSSWINPKKCRLVN